MSKPPLFPTFLIDMLFNSINPAVSDAFVSTFDPILERSMKLFLKQNPNNISRLLNLIIDDYTTTNRTWNNYNYLYTITTIYVYIISTYKTMTIWQSRRCNYEFALISDYIKETLNFFNNVLFRTRDLTFLSKTSLKITSSYSPVQKSLSSCF